MGPLSQISNCHCMLCSGDQYQSHLIQAEAVNDVRWLLVYDIHERPQLGPLLTL